MAWPTYSDVAARTGLEIETSGADEGKIDYTAVGGQGKLDVTGLLTRAKAFCAAYCHRDPANGFDEATVVDTLDGGTILQVSHPPIVSLTSVVWDGTTLSYSDEDYYWYKKGYVYISTKEADLLESYKRYTRSRQVAVITYVGGYSDDSGTHIAIPLELKDIVLDVACRWVLKYDEQYRRGYGAKQLKIAEWSVVHDEGWLKTIYERLRSGDWYVAGVA